MKKCLVLILVLGMASLAFAGSVRFEVDASDVKTSYMPSDVITVNIVSDVGTFGITMDAIGDDAGGQAQTPLELNAGYTLFPNAGTIVNSNGVLISGVAGTITFGAPEVSGVLYSFEYHVPSVIESTSITISAVFPTGGEINEIDLGYPNVATPDAMTIHVGVPEPATMALLGLGGLLLRRSKKLEVRS